MRAICCHRDIADQALAMIPGTSISPTTITRMATLCLGVSAGFTIPSMSQIAVRMIAMVRTILKGTSSLA
jgi:undecaprenyl pyrophosphate phosphatase UppP